MNAKDIIRLFENAPFLGRHGDVIIAQDDGAEVQGEKCPGKELAFGEATGHAHRIVKGRAKVLKVANAVAQRLVDVAHRALLDHEEHATKALPKGTHRSGIQAQWTPEGLRRVED